MAAQELKAHVAVWQQPGNDRLKAALASAALSALLACVEGAAEDAVAEGVLGKLLNAASTLGEEESSRGTLDLNALDCFRILATNEAGAASLIADDEVMAFVTARCGGAGGGQVQAVSESALDVLCVLLCVLLCSARTHARLVRWLMCMLM